MKLLDANILLYAYNSSSQEHEQAQRWLKGAFAAPDPVGLCWPTISAFLRISTNSRIFQQPLQTGQATRIVSQWLSHPSVTLLAPGDRYWSILSGLVVDSQCRGPLVSDASLAALALEHGAVLCTTDKDFTRFSELRTLNPLADA
jgi:toxin-antitoxin system PIN domain toxin